MLENELSWAFISLRLYYMISCYVCYQKHSVWPLVWRLQRKKMVKKGLFHLAVFLLLWESQSTLHTCVYVSTTWSKCCHPEYKLSSGQGHPHTFKTSTWIWLIMCISFKKEINSEWDVLHKKMCLWPPLLHPQLIIIEPKGKREISITGCLWAVLCESLFYM